MSARRDFIRQSIGASLAATTGGLGCGVDEKAPEQRGPVLPDGLDPEDFIVHGTNPITAETRRELFGTSIITPIDHLFIRNNLPLPERTIVETTDEWTIRFDGVERPDSLRLETLRSLEVKTVAAVLQCSGNGRGFFGHDASGSQWKVGAAGCVVWSGVPVASVTDYLGGVTSDARFLTGTGGENLPDGIERETLVVERSIPVGKGLEDAILAWEVNGLPIPISHGGPVRLVVPGFYGCNNIKYVSRVAFTAEESSARIMKTGYRMRDIGVPADPSQPTMWAMNVKSWINGVYQSPSGTIAHGIAFGGEKRVASVEISSDDGVTWKPTHFIGPDLGRFAWRPFAARIELSEGPLRLFSRATDADGNMQPENRMENERGYGNNSWRDHVFSTG